MEILVILLIAGVLAWVFRRRGRRFSPAWGTVYIFHDEAVGLAKVGTTRRLSKTRKCEVSRTMAGGGHLRQVYAVDTYGARELERRAHERLRLRNVRSRAHGVEWFDAATPADLQDIIAAVEDEAVGLRRDAIALGVWPAAGDAKARTWRPGLGRRPLVTPRAA